MDGEDEGEDDDELRGCSRGLSRSIRCFFDEKVFEAVGSDRIGSGSMRQRAYVWPEWDGPASRRPKTNSRIAQNEMNGWVYDNSASQKKVYQHLSVSQNTI